MIWYDLESWPRNFIQGHWTSIDQRHSVDEVWARLVGGKRIYDPDKDFSHISVMMLTFDLETSFNVTAHALLKSTLWVKFEPDWNKGKEDKLQTSDLGRKDGCMDWLITIKIKFKRDPALENVCDLESHLELHYPVSSHFPAMTEW